MIFVPVANSSVNGLLSTDPTINNINTSQPSTSNTLYEIADQKLIEPKDLEGSRADLTSLFCSLSWRSYTVDGGGGGGGDIKWAIVAQNDELAIGAAADANYEAISTELAMTTSATNYKISGYINTTAKAPFYLALLAKVDDAQDSIFTFWRTDGYLDLQYYTV